MPSSYLNKYYKFLVSFLSDASESSRLSTIHAGIGNITDIEELEQDFDAVSEAWIFHWDCRTICFDPKLTLSFEQHGLSQALVTETLDGFVNATGILVNKQHSDNN